MKKPSKGQQPKRKPVAPLEGERSGKVYDPAAIPKRKPVAPVTVVKHA